MVKQPHEVLGLTPLPAGVVCFLKAFVFDLAAQFLQIREKIARGWEAVFDLALHREAQFPHAAHDLDPWQHEP